MSTMNPEEIRRLPVNRNLLYNGLSREQVIAIGANPDEVEAGRMAHNEWAAQQRLNEDAQLALAAQQAVAEGETTYAEAAAALLAAGRHDAHNAVVQQWREDEGWYAAQDAADALAYLDAEEYVQHVNVQQEREREQLVQQAQEAARQLEAAKLTQLIDQFEQFKQSVPGAHQIAPDVEKQLVEKIRQDGIPPTEAEAQSMVATALQESAVLGAATESLRQQVDQEWRLHRKANGARDGLMTQGDIGRAESAFKEARLAQLADAKMINLDDLKPGPTAEEQSNALVEKYRDKQEKSTAFGQNAADIATRGKDTNATRDRGEGISEEKRAYREALKRAEHEANFGHTPEIKSGYGPEAVQETPASNDSRLPEGFVDEYGPGLLGTPV
jgi:hypothetical protein